MNVTLTSLEALILKATHESLPCPDAASLDAFCAVLRDSAEGPQLAAQALAARIHTPNAREAMLALTMLDRCMRRCDGNFHAEVGKFRFLNEMIKLVSPKYLADRTAPEVRTRVLQLLHAWSIEYPNESKFKVAYDMLKNQGVVKETPPPLPPEDETLLSRKRLKNAIFEDEEKSKLLQKLLQSKKPEDIQHANRLIKTMVREEERRSEASSRRAQEVCTALDSAGLLRDMLEYSDDASPEEEQLIHELSSICVKMKPVLEHLAAADTQSVHLVEILLASDILDEVIKKYNAFMETKNKEKKDEHPPGNSLLDFAGASGDANAYQKPKKEAKLTTIDELGDIFSTESGAGTIAEPLKPVSLLSNEDVDLLGEKNKAEGWHELDSLGEQLMKQSLPDNAKRLDSFNSKSKKKPMNEMTSPKHVYRGPRKNGPIFDLNFFLNKENDKIIEELTTPRPPAPAPAPAPASASQSDDVMVDITPVNNNSILDLTVPVDNEKVEQRERDKNKNKSEVKPLADISVSLDNVTPSKVAPLTAFEDESGVTVVLHFCADRPRPDVSVMVVSTTSRSKSPIQDYRFQGSVPKGCKVRLLTPSGSSLPAYNPFLPPPALTQVMLLSRPPSAPPIGLKFVVTFTCDDDVCTEMGEVKELPLDEV